MTIALIVYAFVVLFAAMQVPAASFSPVTDAQFQVVFGQSLWIIAGSVTAFALSQLVDVGVFWLVRHRTGGRFLWMRATGSTIVSQLIDSFVIIGIAFWLPGKVKTSEFLTVAASNYSFKLLIALGVLMLFGLVVPVLGGGAWSGLWLMFIGWFLSNAALASYRQLLVKETLEAVPVARLMRTQLDRVDPELSVRQLVEEHLMQSGQRVLPVERDGRFLGLVSVSDLQKSERRAWDRMTAREIMTPVERLACVGPAADAGEALAELARRNVNQLPVLEDGRLVGLLRREDVIKWLALNEAAALNNRILDALGIRR